MTSLVLYMRYKARTRLSLSLLFFMCNVPGSSWLNETLMRWGTFENKAIVLGKSFGVSGWSTLQNFSPIWRREKWEEQAKRLKGGDKEDSKGNLMVRSSSLCRISEEK